MIDITLRCFNRARWLSFATAQNIINAQGIPPIGYDIDEIGAYIITPAILNGTLITTPAIYDTWHMVHLRLSSSKYDADRDVLFPGETDTTLNFTQSKMVASIRNQATLQTFNGWRAYEFGTLTQRIQLIDPRDYVTKRIWLGGMNF